MTHSILKGIAENSMTSKVLTEFMIDLAAAMARDDYETRRKRQAQGIEKAKGKAGRRYRVYWVVAAQRTLK